MCAREVCPSAVQGGEKASFYDQLVHSGWAEATRSLGQHQLEVFKKACGFMMISAEGADRPFFGDSRPVC